MDYIRLLGRMPEQLPLDAVVLESMECGPYTRQLVEYTVDVRERVQAYLLIPHGVRRGPGVLAVHQDGDRQPYEFGKSEPAGVGGDPELAYGHELCLRGYTVICLRTASSST